MSVDLEAARQQAGWIFANAKALLLDEEDEPELLRAGHSIRALCDEVERLQALIDDAAAHWLSLQVTHPIRWEGALDAAMLAACTEIRRLNPADVTLNRNSTNGRAVVIESPQPLIHTDAAYCVHKWQGVGDGVFDDVFWLCGRCSAKAKGDTLGYTLPKAGRVPQEIAL